MSRHLVRLGDIAKVRQGPVAQKGDPMSGSCLSIGVTELTHVIVRPEKLQPGPCPASFERHVLQDGDVIVSNRNRPLRASAFEDGDRDRSDLPVIAANHCLVISPNQNAVLPVFLAGLLRSGYGQILAEGLYTASTSISLINLKALSGLEIPLPALSEQQLIAQIFIEHQHYVSALAKEISLSETLLTATLARVLKARDD